MTEMPPVDTRRAVVVGGSLAGLRAAEGLRRGGFAGEIVVIDAEPHMPYNRPPLSKGEWNRQSVDSGALDLRIPRSLADVQWRLGSAVVSADLAAREVVLADGSTVQYDGLICASGLAARRLPHTAAMAARHVIRTREDAERLFAALDHHRTLLVIGAGFLGCEVAYVAAAQGIEVSVVASDQVPMQRPLGHWVGKAMGERLAAAGVNFHLGRRVVSIADGSAGDDGPVGAGADAGGAGGAVPEAEVTLDDGTVLRSPVVLEAVGGVPAVNWLAEAGVDLSDGVLTDEYLRVAGAPGVYACGDVCNWPNRQSTDDAQRVEHWTTAAETGRTAGQNLAAYLGGAEPSPFSTLPSFWSDLLGLRIQAFGSPRLADREPTLLEGRQEGEFVAGYYRGERIVGVVLVGLPSRMGHYREMLAESLQAGVT